jgi:hypothetical protein
MQCCPKRRTGRPLLWGRFGFVSRTKEAVYRESGEADYDEAGSPQKREPEQSEDPPVVRQLGEARRRTSSAG